MKVYLIGSLRNPSVVRVANRLDSLRRYEVFADWHAAGEIADDSWQLYEKTRGRTYGEALNGYAARHVFQFDKHHLDTSGIATLVMPAGKSGHLELGYMVGRGKETHVLFDQEPERWDVMYQFANKVFFSEDDYLDYMSRRP